MSAFFVLAPPQPGNDAASVDAFYKEHAEPNLIQRLAHFFGNARDKVHTATAARPRNRVKATRPESAMEWAYASHV